jgi:hypothetical protein
MLLWRHAACGMRLGIHGDYVDTADATGVYGAGGVAQ